MRTADKPQNRRFYFEEKHGGCFYFAGYQPQDMQQEMKNFIEKMDSDSVKEHDRDFVHVLDLLDMLWPETEFMTVDGFDDAIIGVDNESKKVVYSVSKCIKVLMEGGMEQSEAEDYFSYNVRGAKYGELTPLWCEDQFLHE